MTSQPAWRDSSSASSFAGRAESIVEGQAETPLLARARPRRGLRAPAARLTRSQAPSGGPMVRGARHATATTSPRSSRIITRPGSNSPAHRPATPSVVLENRSARSARPSCGQVSAALGSTSQRLSAIFGLATQRRSTSAIPRCPTLLLKRGEALRLVGRSEDAAGLQRQAVAHSMRRPVTRGATPTPSAGWRSRSAGPTRTRASGWHDMAVDMLDDARQPRVDLSPGDVGDPPPLAGRPRRRCSRATGRTLTMSQVSRTRHRRRARSACTVTRASSSVTRTGSTEMEEAIALAEESGSAGEIFGLRDAYARCICVLEGPEEVCIDSAVDHRGGTASGRRERRGLRRVRRALSPSLRAMGRVARHGRRTAQEGLARSPPRDRSRVVRSLYRRPPRTRHP